MIKGDLVDKVGDVRKCPISKTGWIKSELNEPECLFTLLHKTHLKVFPIYQTYFMGKTEEKSWKNVVGFECKDALYTRLYYFCTDEEYMNQYRYNRDDAF